MKKASEHVCEFLNELLRYDEAAIAALIKNRVPCNNLLASSSRVTTTRNNHSYYVGLLGIINGYLGNTIMAVEDTEGNLIEFRIKEDKP